jgi:hypothetical protein
VVERVIAAVLWLYWRANRGFLERFAVALIGRNPGNVLLDPDGRAVVRELDRLMTMMTRAVFVQAALSVLVMPLWVPRKLPYSPLARLLLGLLA